MATAISTWNEGYAMMIDTSSMVSIAEANQNFSRVERLVDETGAAVILKNNVPRYLVIDFQQVEEERQMPDEDLLDISRRLMEKNRQAYQELAK